MRAHRARVRDFFSEAERMEQTKKHYERTREYKKIKASLVGQLENRGADLACFLGLIEDYMTLWAIERMLEADIAERGIVYKDFSSVGTEMQKNNPSVKELVGINRQMLAIIEKLNLSTTEVGGANDDEL
jgi:hypothetical protein